MKQIIKYQAADNKIFDTEEECVKYEKVLVKVTDFLKQFPNSDNYDISCGKGYIQHKKGTYKEIETKLVKLANDWFDEKFKFFCYPLARLIDDSNMKCLNLLSYKLMCINKDKEYEQPYYANNPDKCKNIQVN